MSKQAAAMATHTHTHTHTHTYTQKKQAHQQTNPTMTNIFLVLLQALNRLSACLSVQQVISFSTKKKWPEK